MVDTQAATPLQLPDEVEVGLGALEVADADVETAEEVDGGAEVETAEEVDGDAEVETAEEVDAGAVTDEEEEGDELVLLGATEELEAEEPPPRAALIALSKRSLVYACDMSQSIAPPNEEYCAFVSCRILVRVAASTYSAGSVVAVFEAGAPM